MASNLLNNKKGYSFSGWTEAIILSVIIVLAIGFIFVDLNDIHGGSYSIGLGTDDTIAAVNNLQTVLQNKTNTGTASFGTVAGITLSSSWDIVVTILSLIWNFISGNWINTICLYINPAFPPIIALLLRGLYFLSIGFILLKILFKVRV
jgi:hypothetical protein